MLMQAINTVTVDSLYVIDHFKNKPGDSSPEKEQDNVRRRLNFDFLANTGTDSDDANGGCTGGSMKPVVLKKS